ncbi:MAG: hydrogenase nickel incorporation protein HypB [Hyphomicrobiales bacterium]|nr:hydrogenase nickel incorporation protein HypB [Hyphomicrobiales bacterium]
MCTVCGCGNDEPRIEGHHHHGHHVHEGHHHTHADPHGGGLAAVHLAGLDPERIVQVERDILSLNDAHAAANRARLAAQGIFALNLVSSPGSGKTTLLARTVADLKARRAIAVIEGDQQTVLDADRIRETGVPAIQVNTGKGCHLDAHMVGHALDGLGLEAGGLLFIENVGNLVCPAAFDLGEAHKAVILSVTEGADKPLKYPDMFAAADVMVINKIDLLPYVDFDVDRCVEYARRIRPDMEVVRTSATTGQGLADWYAWITARRDAFLAAAWPGRRSGSR